MNGVTSTPSNWFPVLTLLVGFLSASVLDWLRDRRSIRRERESAEGLRVREREARQAARDESRYERRTDFQRQTLLDLQDAMMRLVRTVGEMHHQDVMTSRKTGKWQKQLYGEDLNSRTHLAMVQTLTLGVRVRDEMVRTLTMKLRDQSVHISMCSGPEEAQRSMLEMMSTFSDWNARIGEVLRKLDDGEDPY